MKATLLSSLVSKVPSTGEQQLLCASALPKDFIALQYCDTNKPFLAGVKHDFGEYWHGRVVQELKELSLDSSALSPEHKERVYNYVLIAVMETNTHPKHGEPSPEVVKRLHKLWRRLVKCGDDMEFVATTT